MGPGLTAFGRHAVDPQSVCGLPCRRHAVTYAITLYERMLGPGAAGSTAVDVLKPCATEISQGLRVDGMKAIDDVLR